MDRLPPLSFFEQELARSFEKSMRESFPDTSSDQILIEVANFAVSIRWLLTTEAGLDSIEEDLDSLESLDPSLVPLARDEVEKGRQRIRDVETIRSARRKGSGAEKARRGIEEAIRRELVTDRDEPWKWEALWDHFGTVRQGSPRDVEFEGEFYGVYWELDQEGVPKLWQQTLDDSGAVKSRKGIRKTTFKDYFYRIRRELSQ